MSEVSREGRKDFFSWALRLRARPVVSARSPFTPPKSWKTAASASSPVWWRHVLERSKSSVFLMMYKIALTGEELSRCIF